MNVKNLPQMMKLQKEQTCYECKKKIKKGELAIYYWWVMPKANRYSHSKCAKTINDRPKTP